MRFEWDRLRLACYWLNLKRIGIYIRICSGFCFVRFLV
nr:MAG TPA: hypothetical protein [Caudoviricetes sp.]